MPDDTLLWRLTPHCCRVCFGRVLENREQDVPRYRCSCCSAKGTGDSPAVLCACGLKFKGTAADANVRCHVNPEPSSEFPALITASQVARPAP